MDGSHTSRFFLEPQQTFQRQYEALRAIFVEGQPLDQVAVRFGYKSSALRSMVSRFRADCRRGVTPPFFTPTDADVPSG
jgi:DNA-directed RNA polymerase specialized sigma24 family protein